MASQILRTKWPLFGVNHMSYLLSVLYRPWQTIATAVASRAPQNCTLFSESKAMRISASTFFDTEKLPQVVIQYACSSTNNTTSRTCKW